MNPAAQQEALEAINKEATRLLDYVDHPETISEGLKLIVALSRYQHDVRTAQERERSESDAG